MNLFSGKKTKMVVRLYINLSKTSKTLINQIIINMR